MPFSLTGLTLPLILRPAIALTDEELMRFSEENKPYKIERNRQGEITVMTPVGGIGGTHENYVAAMLYVWTEQVEKGISFGSNTGFNLPDGSCLSPDAAWLALDRWEALTPKEQAGYPPLCPDFLIEIRSRSDSRRMLEEKMQLWMENGAQLAWLLDPVDGNATIYTPDAAPCTLERPVSLTGTAPVEGFTLHMTRLWTSA